MTSSTPPEPPFEITRDGEVATVWLNRPEKRNAVTFEMWEALPGVLATVEEEGTRVLVVRGRGGHFCAGADITGLGRRLADAGTPGGYREVNALAEEALTAFRAPTIAVLEGNCIGGGWQIASACDLRLASSDLLLGITPAKLGITYPLGAVARTVSLCGPSTTKRLLFTAELITAAESKELHLVDYVVEAEELEGALRTLTDELQERSLLTQLATKDTVNELVGDRTTAAEVLAGYESIARDSVDLDEGLSAFEERRAARFSWRP